MDKATGRTLWQATSEGRSYATPVAATIHGRRHVFVFARDGLVSIDPGTGRVDWEFPFRARSPEVINATSPITMRDLVFVTGYQAGCLCVRVLPGGGCEEVYRNTQKVLDCQYNNLVCADGFSRLVFPKFCPPRLVAGEVIQFHGGTERDYAMLGHPALNTQGPPCAAFLNTNGA